MRQTLNQVNTTRRSNRKTTSCFHQVSFLMLRIRFIMGGGLSLLSSLIFEGRELLEAGKTKLLQEFEGRSEDDRATYLLQSPLFLDKASVDECPEYTVRVDAADGFDLGAGDRLAVGDNGQGLEGSWRESGG
jgi:hypothetical protein